MKNVHRLASIVLACFVASNASSASARPRGSDDIVDGVQVGVGSCSFVEARDDETKSRIFAAIATAAISKGVNLLASAVTEAAKAKTWSATGARNFEASSDKFPQCVQVARGRFYSKDAVVGPWVQSWKGNANALRENGLFLADTPDFFFEGEISLSSDKSALAIRPVFSSFNRPIGTRWLRPGRARSIAVFFAITPPGTSPNLANAPAASLVLGELQPAASKIYAQGGKTYRSPLESTWFTLTKTEARKPFTVHALVTETQGASAFLAFIGSVLSEDKVKQEIAAQANQLVVPGAAAAAAAAEAQTTATNDNSADQKFATAVAKLDTCRAATTGVVAAASEAKIALRNYMLADQALDEKSRTGLITEDQLNKLDLTNAATLKVSCEELYQHLVNGGA